MYKASTFGSRLEHTGWLRGAIGYVRTCIQPGVWRTYPSTYVLLNGVSARCIFRDLSSHKPGRRGSYLGSIIRRAAEQEYDVLTFSLGTYLPAM